MKAQLLLMFSLLAVAPAGAFESKDAPVPTRPAGWSALKLQLTLSEAAAIMVGSVGQPILVHRGRNGVFEQWFYDRGGWLFFQKGRLVYWQMSAPNIRSKDSASEAAAKVGANSQASPGLKR